nr:unnamed protein product [Spirometra erinaceieuropaei]
MSTTALTADHTLVALLPSAADIIHPALTSASTTATCSTNTTTSCTPSTGGATSDAPLLATITTSIPTSSDVDLAHTCLHCDRTETGEPVPGAPTYTRHIRIDCHHCPRIDLLGRIRIHISCGARRTTAPASMKLLALDAQRYDE